MNYFLLFFGIVIYISIVADVVMTTLTMQGGGWLTNRISRRIWNFTLWLSDYNGESKFLTHIGYLLLVFIILFWVAMLNMSFVLVLSFDTGSIINSSTKLPVDFWGKLYYAGFNLSTLGIGDYIASSNVWRLVSIIYSFTGLILITMSITYFLSVLGAVIKKRKLGILLKCLGKNPQEIVITACNPHMRDAIRHQLSTLSSELVEHSQNHRAYPIIHYFHDNKKENSIIVRLATVNEAVYIIKDLIKQDLYFESDLWNSLDTALNNYVDVVLEVSGMNYKKNLPSNILLNKLKDLDMLCENIESKIEIISNKIQKRHAVLYQLVIEDGWEWQDALISYGEQ